MGYKNIRINNVVQMTEDKVVHIYESAEMADKEVYCDWSKIMQTFFLFTYMLHVPIIKR